MKWFQILPRPPNLRSESAPNLREGEGLYGILRPNPTASKVGASRATPVLLLSVTPSLIPAVLGGSTVPLMICFQRGLGVLFFPHQAQLRPFKQDALKPGRGGGGRGVSTGSVPQLSSLCHMPPLPSALGSATSANAQLVHSMCKSPLSAPQEHPPARAPGSARPRSQRARPRGKQRPRRLWEAYLPDPGPA